MADLAELGFVVKDEPLARAEDKLDRLVPAADRAAKATDRFNKAAGDTSSPVQKAASGVGNLTTAVAKLASGVAAYLSVNAIIGYADAWSDMQSRVGAAIKDMEAAPALMQRLVDIANASYSPLSQTVEIYGRNVAVMKDLGLTANQVADATESLNHMLVITATRGERAESVQNALSKAMAVGKLQAEGLETVLANGGRVAEALAAELGTTVSGLRQMASEGKITGQVIANALLTSLEDVRVQAGEMTATVADAFVIMNNNITAAIGQWDKATGASARLAEGIIFLADNLNVVGAVIGGIAAVMFTALIPALVAGTGAALAFTGALLTNPLTAIAVVIGLLVTRLILLIQQIGGVGVAFQQVQMIGIDIWTRITAAAEGFGASMNAITDNIVSYFAQKWAQLLEVVIGGISKINTTFNTGIDLTPLVNAHAEAMTTVNAATSSAAANSERAAAAWGRVATGSRMDPTGMGADWDSFNATFNQTAETAEAVSAGMTNVGSAAGAANDNVKQLAGATNELTEAQKQLQETYEFGKQTVGTFFSDFKRELKDGASIWEAFAQAGINALDGIADRALQMAANGIWDMIFGAFTGGGVIGVGGVGMPTGGFIPGLTGPRLFSEGGYTGNVGRSDAAGIVHGQEYVLNADATRRIGVGNLNAMNQNLPVDMGGSGGDTFVIHFNPIQQIDGIGLDMEQVQEVVRVSNENMLDSLPGVIQEIQRDPHKRMVRVSNTR